MFDKYKNTSACSSRNTALRCKGSLIHLTHTISHFLSDNLPQPLKLILRSAYAWSMACFIIILLLDYCSVLHVGEHRSYKTRFVNSLESFLMRLLQTRVQFWKAWKGFKQHLKLQTGKKKTRKRHVQRKNKTKLVLYWDSSNRSTYTANKRVYIISTKYNTKLAHEFYDTEVKQQWILRTFTLKSYTTQKQTPHLFRLAVPVPHAIPY